MRGNYFNRLEQKERPYVDVTVIDSKRFASTGGTGGWGFFDFNHFEPKAPTTKVRAESECAYCHMAGAKKDQVWTQFDRLLDK